MEPDGGEYLTASALSGSSGIRKGDSMHIGYTSQYEAGTGVEI